MDHNEAEKIVEDLAPRIERLKALYEQYFMGIEKLEPGILRKDVERTIWTMRRTRVQNTRLRFKFQQLVQRYNTYQQYWKRIMRQIEAGTYKRHVLRAAKTVGRDAALQAGGTKAQALVREMDDLDTPTPPRGVEAARTWQIDEDDQPTPPSMRVSSVDDQPTPPRGMPVARPGDGQPPPPRPGPPPPSGRRPLPPPRRRDDAAGGHAVDPNIVPASAQHEAPRPVRPPPKRVSAHEQATRSLYQQYVAAKRTAGESTAGVTYERLARSLQKQTDKLRQQHAGKNINYEVVTKNGKTLIRPVIK